jgi:hypothetical protein
MRSAALAFAAGVLVGVTAARATAGPPDRTPTPVAESTANPAPTTAPVPTALWSGLSTLAALGVFGIHRRFRHRRD